MAAGFFHFKGAAEPGLHDHEIIRIQEKIMDVINDNSLCRGFYDFLTGHDHSRMRPVTIDKKIGNLELSPGEDDHPRGYNFSDGFKVKIGTPELSAETPADKFRNPYQRSAVMKKFWVPGDH